MCIFEVDEVGFADIINPSGPVGEKLKALLFVFYKYWAGLRFPCSEATCFLSLSLSSPLSFIAPLAVDGGEIAVAVSGVQTTEGLAVMKWTQRVHRLSSLKGFGGVQSLG